MTAWLFTWNADRWLWDNYDEECEGLSEDYPFVSWSCQSKKVQAGDEFFLIKLGKPPRGIIGHGIVIDDMFDDIDWDEDRGRKITHYVPGEWDTLLNYKTQEILDVAVLDEKCRDQFWHPQGSGKESKTKYSPHFTSFGRKLRKSTPKTLKRVYIMIQTQQAEYSKAQKNPFTPQNTNETPKSEEISCTEKSSSAKYAALTLRQYTVN